MTDISKMKKLISETFPNLGINEFALLGKGKSGIICLVNNEIVFKIPLNSENDTKNEAAVLRFLKGKLDIEVPEILYTGTSESGLFIIGETLLSGTTLSYELYDTFTAQIKNDILRQLGKIARSLHEAGGNDSSWQTGSNEETSDKMLGEFNERFTAEIQNIFSGEEISKIKNIAEYYKKISEKHPVKPVLCHFDLHFCNMMFDIESKRITGLLDFGCAGYSEPARDFHYYFEPKYVLEGYGDNWDKYFSDRQRFHALSWLFNNLGYEISEQKPRKSFGFIKEYILN